MQLLVGCCDWFEDDVSTNFLTRSSLIVVPYKSPSVPEVIAELVGTRCFLLPICKQSLCRSNPDLTHPCALVPCLQVESCCCWCWWQPLLQRIQLCVASQKRMSHTTWPKCQMWTDCQTPLGHTPKCQAMLMLRNPSPLCLIGDYMFLMPHRAVWVAFCLWRLGKTTNSALYTRRVSFVKVPPGFAAASWRTATPSVAQWCILALVDSRRQQSRINLSLTPSRRRFGIQCIQRIRCIPPITFTQDGMSAAFANLIMSAAFANRIMSFIAATIMVILWNATAIIITVTAGARIFVDFDSCMFSGRGFKAMLLTTRVNSILTGL